MNCRECADFLSEYLADELPQDVRTTFEGHMARCRNCLVYMEQLRKTIEAGKQAFTDDPAAPPPDIPEEIVRAILAARKDLS